MPTLSSDLNRLENRKDVKPVVCHTLLVFWLVHLTILDCYLYKQTIYTDFLYWFLYIYIFTVNCKNKNKIKRRKCWCCRNFSNRNHLGTIKQTLNDSFINRGNEPRIYVHHSKRKPNQTWSDVNFNWRNKKRGKTEWPT